MDESNLLLEMIARLMMLSIDFLFFCGIHLQTQDRTGTRHPVVGSWALKRGYLATVRNKRVIDSERVQGHYLPVISMVLGKGGRDDLGARMF